MPRHPEQRPGPTARPGGTHALRAAGPASPPPRPGRTWRALRSDRGQVALEYIGFVPILLFVALCGIQLGWIAYVHEQADTAARTAARVEAKHPGRGEAAGRAAIRDGLSAQISVPSGGDAITATVTIKINSIVPGLDIPEAKATAVMPNDDPKGP
ncbi:TadE/TadG family type IV pilus assembly protein [Streptomyces sp. NPDC001594]|uniref:TadE/TadG family type IV pilus assembly protein n=1 Tax=Streptomyces sp. NPDC001594 TaxID=3364590 RepID=UPI0036A509CA